MNFIHVKTPKMIFVKIAYLSVKNEMFLTYNDF